MTSYLLRGGQNQFGYSFPGHNEQLINKTQVPNKYNDMKHPYKPIYSLKKYIYIYMFSSKCPFSYSALINFLIPSVRNSWRSCVEKNRMLLDLMRKVVKHSQCFTIWPNIFFSGRNWENEILAEYHAQVKVRDIGTFRSVAFYLCTKQHCMVMNVSHRTADNSSECFYCAVDHL